MIAEYEITDPRTRPCEFCGQEAHGRVMIDLYGGSLMVCMTCYELLRGSRSHPYSKAMEKFAMRSVGYHITAKMARLGR